MRRDDARCAAHLSLARLRWSTLGLTSSRPGHTPPVRRPDHKSDRPLPVVGQLAQNADRSGTRVRRLVVEVSSVGDLIPVLLPLSSQLGLKAPRLPLAGIRSPPSAVCRLAPLQGAQLCPRREAPRPLGHAGRRPAPRPARLRVVGQRHGRPVALPPADDAPFPARKPACDRRVQDELNDLPLTPDRERPERHRRAGAAPSRARPGRPALYEATDGKLAPARRLFSPAGKGPRRAGRLGRARQGVPPAGQAAAQGADR